MAKFFVIRIWKTVNGTYLYRPSWGDHDQLLLINIIRNPKLLLPGFKRTLLLLV